MGPFPQNRRGRLRVSTAIAYLLPARHRPNLTIRPHCLVNRVLVDGDRAVGVEIAGEGEPEQVRGRRVTLAAGAIGSPAILLRSGIGPRAALAGWASSPVADLPGVGAGLADHPVTRLLLVPKPGSCDPGPRSRRWCSATPHPAPPSSTTCSRSCSATSTWPASAASRRWQRWAHRWRSGCPWRSNARTARGRLELASTDPRVPPRDPARLRRRPGGSAAARRGRPPRLADRAPAGDRPPHATASPCCRRRRWARTTRSAAYVRATVSTQFHPCGTAAMGPAGDADGSGRPALPAPRHPQPARGRCVGHADHPTREHQPHLHHDRRARIRLDAWGGVIKASGAPSTSCRLARGGNLCGSPDTLGPTGAW